MFATLPKMSGDDPQTLMRDVYESKFGIHNHLSGTDKKSRPLASIATHKAENTYLIKSVRDLIGLYIDKDIMKYSGISYDQFMEMTKEEIKSVLYWVSKKAEREANVAASVERATQLAMQGGRGGGNTSGKW